MKCRRCGGELKFVAEMGAPGVGQVWECEHGHPWQKLGATLVDLETGPPVELTEEDVR